MRFTFVGDVAGAIEQARDAATHGDVVIMGGRDVIGQALEQGLVDELRLHLAPMLARWRHAALQERDAPDLPAA
jgi:dihydrofolate reductase